MRTETAVAKPASAPSRKLPKEIEAHKWQPGQSGNPSGRNKGSRNKLAEQLFDDFLGDWLEASDDGKTTNGQKVIAKVRGKDPSTYLRIAASLLPKQLEVSRARDMSDEELERRLAALVSALPEILELQAVNEDDKNG